MGYEAVVFDLDGTLVHTAPEYRYLVVEQTLRDLWVVSSNHNVDRYWFEARRDRIIQEQFGVEPEQFREILGKYDAVELRRKFTKAYDDVDFIQELRQLLGLQPPTLIETNNY